VFFLIPVCVLIFISSWDYVLSSWSIAESSAENDGLPYIYLLKTLMLIMPITLLLQGVSEILRSALVVVGWQGDVETRISQEPTL
jgi:TRAP-type mannitol/chloroaromatic compound transport system permease small subunit